MTDQQSISQQASVETVEEGGVRARKAFMLRHFIPTEPEWIIKNVVAKGKGTRVTLGRVYGVVTGTDVKENTLPDGSVISSIVLKGVIMSESFITGEVGQSATAYLPDSYASKVDALFKADDNLKMVEIDCDIGLEATGKSIPYEWVVVAFREGEEMAVLKRLRNSRSTPNRPRPALGASEPAPALPAPEPAPAIEGEVIPAAQKTKGG